ncbi:MAG: hypothetical protein CTY35_09920 [Methylotenera sp.]|nr:MAG: hypothetical protein CTY35_09920 [Methylotenera sp.]PPD18642.1 MAG: hypothetical protein CTY27_01145 [Methylotenera sp.]
MTDTTHKQDELRKFFQTQLEELLEMSDEEILEGSDAEELKIEGIAMIAAAKAKIGSRRMAAAKATMATRKVSTSPIMSTVNIDEARAYLQAAANDSRITIAARALGEMSDADIVRIYTQLNKLQQDTGDSK